MLVGRGLLCALLIAWPLKGQSPVPAPGIPLGLRDAIAEAHSMRVPPVVGEWVLVVLCNVLVKCCFPTRLGVSGVLF